MKIKSKYLNNAYNLIESQNIKVLSLDIFDTLLWRTFPTPHDLFYELGKVLLQKKWLDENVSASLFKELRENASTLR